MRYAQHHVYFPGPEAPGGEREMSEEAEMRSAKKVREIMDDIFDYPHLPYWFSLGQAIKILKKTLPGTDVCTYPRGILIFDERYNLLGTLNIRDILRGLEPRFKSASSEPSGMVEDEATMAGIAEQLYGDESKALLDRPVSDFMIPASVFLDPEDIVTKAAYLMLRHNLIFVPVLEGRKRLVGIVKVIKIFDEITNAVMEE